MPLDLQQPELARLRARLSPYGRELLDKAAEQALFLHASEVGIAHLLCALMNDEDSAAYRAVLHAFADPDTLAHEARALADGILVVGSVCALPFSVLGVKVLYRARELATARKAAEVDVGHLALASALELPADARARLESGGWNPTAWQDASGTASSAAAASHALQAPPPPASSMAEPLFKHFSTASKRGLSAAGRSTQQANEPSISPARILLACLQGSPELEASGGLSHHRARLLLSERTADPTPLAARSLPADPGLTSFLARLAPGAGSLELLANFHSEESPELAQILARNKVTRSLLERSLAAFSDPDVA